MMPGKTTKRPRKKWIGFIDVWSLAVVILPHPAFLSKGVSYYSTISTGSLTTSSSSSGSPGQHRRSQLAPFAYTVLLSIINPGEGCLGIRLSRSLCSEWMLFDFRRHRIKVLIKH
jgi:hypothetical protein